MGAMKEQAKGVGQEVGGKIKEETGDALDDRGMEGRGAAKKIEGQVRQDAARPMEKAEGAGRELKGNVKEEFGRATGNPRLENEGTDEKISGNIKKNSNY
jgi:uncharacterized protein YjbJ (UPF0337 family)